MGHRDPRCRSSTRSGINGQNVFVHGRSQTVVAKLSTWPTALHPAAGPTVAAVLALSAALHEGRL